MKTRFDGTLWIGAGGQAFRPAEMGTDHLLNTVKMLKNRPGVVVAMVVVAEIMAMAVAETDIDLYLYKI